MEISLPHFFVFVMDADSITEYVLTNIVEEVEAFETKYKAFFGGLAVDDVATHVSGESKTRESSECHGAIDETSSKTF